MKLIEKKSSLPQMANCRLIFKRHLAERLVFRSICEKKNTRKRKVQTACRISPVKFGRFETWMTQSPCKEGFEIRGNAVGKNERETFCG